MSVIDSTELSLLCNIFISVYWVICCVISDSFFHFPIFNLGFLDFVCVLRNKVQIGTHNMYCVI